MYGSHKNSSVASPATKLIEYDEIRCRGFCLLTRELSSYLHVRRESNTPGEWRIPLLMHNNNNMYISVTSQKDNTTELCHLFAQN